MADQKTSQLATLATSDLVSGDWIGVVDVSDTSMAASGTNKKIDAGNIAIKAANTFVDTQTIAPVATNRSGVSVNMPANNTAFALDVTCDGVQSCSLDARPESTLFMLSSRALNNNVPGPRMAIGRNDNAGPAGNASGALQFQRANNSAMRVWVDDSGILRIHTAAPTGSTGSATVSDTAGTVIGAQTSSRDAKNVQDELSDIVDVIAAIRQGAEAVKRFTYKSDAFQGAEFEGVIIDDAPRYGMDCDEDHPAGKSLNVVTAIGDLLRAVAHLTDRVEALEARLA